eukprot:765128-Hanusia_phi.AAC.4
MVIKKPKDEAGAFLTVLPRRVFFHVECSNASKLAFDWAASKLLCRDIDEVYLVITTRAVKKSLLLRPKSTSSLQEDELARIEVEILSDVLEKKCNELGIKNVKRLRATGPVAESILRVAMENSCDVLVAGRDLSKRSEDPALYAVHNASFAVISLATNGDSRPVSVPANFADYTSEERFEGLHSSECFSPHQDCEDEPVNKTFNESSAMPAPLGSFERMPIEDGPDDMPVFHPTISEKMPTGSQSENYISSLPSLENLLSNLETIDDMPRSRRFEEEPNAKASQPLGLKRITTRSLLRSDSGSDILSESPCKSDIMDEPWMGHGHFSSGEPVIAS